MRLARTAASVAAAMLLFTPSSAAHATPLPQQQDGRECVMYNDQVVYCIDTR